MLLSRCCNRISSIPWFVFFCCVLNFLEGYAVNGITNINLPALEVQFQLTSSRSGLIASATNIGALTCVLAVSFLGTTRHKPVWTGVGAIIMAIGSLLFIVPHWTAGNYQFPGIINRAKVSTRFHCKVTSITESLTKLFFVLRITINVLTLYSNFLLHNMPATEI